MTVGVAVIQLEAVLFVQPDGEKRVNVIFDAVPVFYVFGTVIIVTVPDADTALRTELILHGRFNHIAHVNSALCFRCQKVFVVFRR